jgi:uncharacterized membrane protein YkoI
MRRTWIIAGSLFFAILLLAAVIVLIFRSDHKASLTLNEAKQEVLSQYEGEIVSAELNGRSYLVRLKSAAGLYELHVDKEDAGITEIKSVERYESSMPGGTASPSANPSNEQEITDPLPTPSIDSPNVGATTNPALLLSEDEASKLALGRVNGNVTDVDIDHVQGKWYYFVEIDTQGGREAEVQLNAASGAILSVTWDDNDDDDNDAK